MEPPPVGRGGAQRPKTSAPSRVPERWNFTSCLAQRVANSWLRVLSSPISSVSTRSCGIRPGDTVSIGAGEEHWHGGTATTCMSHLAIVTASGDTDPTTWLEAVTEEEYAAAQRDLSHSGADHPGVGDHCVRRFRDHRPHRSGRTAMSPIGRAPDTRTGWCSAGGTRRVPWHDSGPWRRW